MGSLHSSPPPPRRCDCVESIKSLPGSASEPPPPSHRGAAGSLSSGVSPRGRPDSPQGGSCRAPLTPPPPISYVKLNFSQQRPEELSRQVWVTPKHRFPAARPRPPRATYSGYKFNGRHSVMGKDWKGKVPASPDCKRGFAFSDFQPSA